MESPCGRAAALRFLLECSYWGARLLLATAHHRRCRSWLETNDDVAMHPRRQRDSRLILGKLACGEILEFVTWGRPNVPGGLRTNRTLPVVFLSSLRASENRLAFSIDQR